MIRLYKIFVRPLFEYGTIATSTATDNTLQPWESTQAKYIKHILNLPNISYENANKFANLPSVKDRNKHLLMKWYHKSTTLNPTIQQFINEHAKDYNKFDKYKTPYKIIKEQLNIT